MADFDAWDREGDEAQGGKTGDGAPVIKGGLLDPRTFPARWPPLTDDPSIEPQAPEITGPVATDVHAEVLNDIRKAQAALPHRRAPDASLRRIDPYPAMNYLPPGRRTAPTVESLRDFLDGVPLPVDAFGPHITFFNDVAGGPSTDRPVTNDLATMVEHAVVDSGLHSVNINSSVRPLHLGSQSNHPKKRAIDVNVIDDFKVIDRPDLAVTLQNAFAPQPMIRENFGPGYQVKTAAPGRKPVHVAKVGESHQNHDHFSSQR